MRVLKAVQLPEQVLFLFPVDVRNHYLVGIVWLHLIMTNPGHGNLIVGEEVGD
jgi:hypothetical protein